MIHNLPQTPAFLDQRPDSQISEVALRVVVELDGWEFYVVGTATLIGGHVAITARHVFDYVVKKFGSKKIVEKEFDSRKATPTTWI